MENEDLEAKVLEMKSKSSGAGKDEKKLKDLNR
jgi:hypothetical protein